LRRRSQIKIKLTDAAAQLDLQVAELVLGIAELVGDFDQIYPHIEDDYVQSFKQMHASRFFGKPVERGRAIDTTPVKPKRPLSTSAVKVLAVMHRRKFWNTNVVQEATLRVHQCRDVEDFDGAVRELVGSGLMQRGRNNTLSLKPEAKAQIEGLLAL
jgi:hypothetical protein